MRYVAYTLAALIFLAASPSAFAQPEQLPGEPPPPDLEVDEKDDEDRTLNVETEPEGEAETKEEQAEAEPGEDEDDIQPAELPPSVTLTFDDVACAPRPQWAPGLRRGPDIEEGWRALPRLLLAPLQRSLVLVLTPLRYGVWTWERYEVKRLVRGVFFDDTLTYGLYPVIEYETQYGWGAGLRFIHKNLFGQRERLKLRASYGARLNQEYSASLFSGKRFERLELRLDLSWERARKARFQGIGNGDLVEFEDVALLVDPLTDDTAVDSRYGDEIIRLALRGSIDLGAGFFATPAFAYTDHEFGTTTHLGTDPYLADVYYPDRVVGFEDGARIFYGELELRYENAHSANPWIPEAAPSSGVDFRLFGGWARDVDRTGFARYGMDLQGYIDLYKGSRVLALRHYMEGITGDLDETAFVELPRLGGPTLLRGYARDRFRDRVAMVTTAEYRWLVFHSGFGYLFVDAGRVFRSVSDIELKDYRIGYGVGLQLHHSETFGLRAQLAHSEDGFFMNLALDRSFYNEPRVQRE